MHLLDLPLELLDHIFSYAVEDRIFKRVMRLRLVSRHFRCLTDEAVYSSRMLDDVAFDSEASMNCAEQHDSPWTLYLRTYLGRRIYQERNAKTMRGQYRQVAEYLWVTGSKIFPGLTLEDCIYDLSAVTFFINSSLETSALLKSTSSKDSFSQPQLATLFLNAVVYMGLEPFARALISEDPNDYWQCPSVAASNKPSFRRLIEMASYRGHLGLVEHLVQVEKNMTHRTYSLMSASTASTILRHASIGGHEDVVEYALNNSNLFNEHLASTTRRNLSTALSYTDSPDIYTRLETIMKHGSDPFETSTRDDVYARLDLAARHGNTEMVRYLLRQDLCLNQPGAHINSVPVPHKPGCDDSVKSRSDFRPLISAIESGNVETVELLLWHGADPNWFPSTRTALMAAVHKGDLAIVRTLVEYGADINVGTPAPVVIAVQQENEEIISYLDSKGALREPEVGAWAMSYAKVFGLDTMVDLLKERGFDANDALHHTPSSEEDEHGRYLFRGEHYGLGALELCCKPSF
ncbi:ankyrin repeat-containing domain protein [Xylaria bambusicola]|uniref:ankyrin repeat-containing domain protein n=1 Tax=Xylaria bambusicola TaxID=326684 RepID=UPI0020084212|nr:ankyrin repeat-containing domain protein [Xylaria bambusicola]KAI0515046.1 ankyrin repeat-containing domain protein [Xylaria bambusicola]